MWVVRRLLAHEYPRYIAHLKQLSAESRYMRFGIAVTDEWIDYTGQAWLSNYRDHRLFAIEDASLELVAVAHVARMGGQVELAFSVLDAYQGQGMGSALMKRVLQYCRVRGLEQGHMVCLPQNTAIQHLCRQHGLLIVREDGEALADVHMPPADWATHISEYTDRGLAVADYWSKRLKVQQSVQ